jgi:putative tributyrin esterase
MPNPFLGHDPESFYVSGKKYPVLWLLHGEYGTLDDWLTYTYVPRLGVWRNTIIVAPEAPNSDFMNQPHVGEGYAYMDFFFHELMPFIYHWFPASDKPENNFLAGCAMGCGAAWRYGLSRPDAFGAIAPIGASPPDYGYLEPYRSLGGAEFRKRAQDPASVGSLATLRARELNAICKYATVGDFLDSIENTMPRFHEAMAKGRLPKVYLPGETGDLCLARFQELIQASGTGGIKFDLWDEDAHSPSFLEKAVERFMDFAGLAEVESREPGLPILCGVHDLDDKIGITVH